jgi:hypothetical protein
MSPMLGLQRTSGLRDLVAFEAIVEAIPVGRDQADGRLREVHRQDQRIGTGDGGEELSARQR